MSDSLPHYRPGLRGFGILHFLAFVCLLSTVPGCDGTALSPVEEDPPNPEDAPLEIVLSETELELDAGDTARIQATVQRDGEPVSDAGPVTWSSSADSIAHVDSTGLVAARHDGQATITASLEDASSQATVSVRPQDPPLEVVLSETELELEAGETARIHATVQRDGEPVSDAGPVSWSSSDSSIADVDAGGLVTARQDGQVTVTASVEDASSQAEVVVRPVRVEPTWDRVIEDTMVYGDVVVPDDEAWLIGANVRVEGNVRTHSGRIGMRPGSSLKFVGADPDAYVGDGLYYTAEYANDYGLWVGGADATGVLDISCTPKQSWNRTGEHETWEPDDEYWIAPTDVGDYSPRRWYPGDPIPQVDPRVPPAEVMNVTRDCVIEGPGHIHIHSQKPQRIEYVQLRRLGVSNAASDGPVMGRYALHLHMPGDGSRGTVIRGVAAIDSRGRVFVPHSAHGVTMIDNVSVNSYSDAFWWDSGDRTEDLLVDRLAVSGVFMPREIGGTSREKAATLGSGSNMEVRNSAVSGSLGSKRSVGWNWFTKDPHVNPAKWIFAQGNVTHNNEGPGIRFWFNDHWDHHVKNAITYRNGKGGIENGAYRNAVRYTDVLLVEDYIFLNSNSNTQSDGGPARYERVVVEAAEGPALTVGHRNLASEVPAEFIDCALLPGPGAPKVLISEQGKNPWHAIFRRCGVTPDDIVFESLDGGNDGTHIIIEHADGRKWEVKAENGQKIVQEL